MIEVTKECINSAGSACREVHLSLEILLLSGNYTDFWREAPFRAPTKGIAAVVMQPCFTTAYPCPSRTTHLACEMPSDDEGAFALHCIEGERCGWIQERMNVP